MNRHVKFGSPGHIVNSKPRRHFYGLEAGVTDRRFGVHLYGLKNLPSPPAPLAITSDAPKYIQRLDGLCPVNDRLTL